MKNLRWIIFLFCIALQIFLWLAPDTDFVDGIFYVNDVGGTVGKSRIGKYRDFYIYYGSAYCLHCREINVFF